MPDPAPKRALVTGAARRIGRALALSLADRGFDVAERFEVPFVFEFADPPTFARTVASTGPAYEAIQHIGEEEFRARATELAEAHVRDGLPLRAPLQVFGYVGAKR